MSQLDLNRRELLIGAGIAAAAVGPAAASAPATGPASFGNRKIPVAILVDDYTNLMDTASAWEPFLAASPERGSKRQLFELFLVSAEARTYHTSGNMPGPNGLRFIPNYTFANAPQPKILVVPSQMDGGAEKRAWVERVEPNVDLMFGICLGPSLLASYGLLDGKSAAAHHAYIDEFATAYPKVKWKRGRRFVDEGKYLTAGGYTSGIDATLHVIARYFGPAIAQETAEWIEHDSEGWKTGLRA